MMQAQAFSSDEIAIYRELLLRYPLAPGDLSGMKPVTLAFVSQLPSWAIHRSELRDVHVIAPSRSGRLLPQEILALADDSRVAQLLAAQGKLVPRSQRTPGHRLDGHGVTHFSVSEIAFDTRHHLAEIVFQADCRCLGGEGGTALFEHTRQGWKLVKVADVWEG